MLRAALSALVVCAGGAASASVPDVFGLGSEESAVAGASAARVHDFSAGHYDPAGLTLLDGPEASLGVLGFGSALTVQKGASLKTQPIGDPVGILVGAATPIPLGGALARRLYVGLALYVVPQEIVRVIAHRPGDAFFPLYDNRTQRLVVLPSLAARIGHGVSVGIAFNYLAGLGGRVFTTVGATRALEARVDEQITSRLSVNAGVRWQLWPRVAVALVYREAFGVPFHSVAVNRVAGEPIDLDVTAEELYTPHELVLGGAIELPRRVLTSLDVAWSHWSGWRGPFVAVTSQLPLVGEVAAPPPAAPFQDTFSLRAGADFPAIERGRAELRVRGGYGFETQAGPRAQPSGTRLLDGPKHRVALGLGGALRLGPARLRLDVHSQLDVMQRARLADVSGGGVAWAVGSTLTVSR
jgi:long-subunit fatty acid transport protein